MSKLKNIPTLNDIRLTKRMNDEFKYDFTFYEKNNMMASRTTNTLSYNILLICHSIEKGMSVAEPKFFGEEKIRRIMELTNMISDKEVYAYNIGMSTIKEYIEFGKKHKFLDNPIYDELSEYIKGKDFKKVPIGAHIVDKKEILIIGDSVTSDMMLGINNGIDTCWFNEENKKTDANITYEVHNYDDILRLLMDES